jgi:hypothetical protein
MKRPFLLLSLFLACVALVLCAPRARAQSSSDDIDDYPGYPGYPGYGDTDGDGVDDDDEDETERVITIEQEPHQIKIESELKTGETKDELEIKFKTDPVDTDSVEIELKYNTDTETLEYESETTVEFLRILGLNDTGETISVYDLCEQEFEVLSVSQSTTGDGETEFVISTQTTDGVFGVTLHAVGRFALMETDTICPSEVKIDINITDYPYSGEETELRLVAELETEVESETEEVEETDDEIEDLTENEEGVNVFNTSTSCTVFFTWSETAMVDSIETPVVSDVIDEELNLTYQRGDVIVHDPKYGVIRSWRGKVKLAPLAGTLGLALLAGVCGLAGVVSARKRRAD